MTLTIGNVLTVTEADGDGWHNGWEHQLVGWDDTHVAAIYSQQRGPAGEGAGGFARMLAVDPGDGTITAGAVVKYYDARADPEDIYNYTNDAIKVGNLLVQWRRDSNRLLTLAYDDATDAFVKVGAQDAPALTFGGGRLVRWTDNTMLMVSERIDANPDRTTLTLARWDGTQWQYGVTTRYIYSTGGGDYVQAAPIALTGGEPAAVVAASFADDRLHWKYALVTGTYPNALTIHTNDASGRFRYYNRELFAMPTTGKVLRMVPLVPGTLTPMPGGGDLDYGVMELSVVDGEVAEGPISSLSPSDDYYDIAMTETTDAQPWAVYEIFATGVRYPEGTLGVQPVGVGPETRITDETPGELGIYPDDVNMRTMAPAGVWAVAGWMTTWNRIFRVQAYGFPVPLEEPVPRITGLAGPTTTRFFRPGRVV